MGEKPYTGYNSKLLDRARNLRKNMTPQESKLWYCFLRRHPVKFYRQRPIDSYIADFYCSKAKLVIEIDGSQHFTEKGLEYDENRTDNLKALDISVIRISNLDVDRNFTTVCEYIDQIVYERMHL